MAAGSFGALILGGLQFQSRRQPTGRRPVPAQFKAFHTISMADKIREGEWSNENQILA